MAEPEPPDRRGWRFPPERREVLSNPERLRPDKPLRAIHPTAGETALDVGAGTGFWTVPLAELVGPTGRVIAADIEPVMLADLRELIAARNLSNVEVLQTGEADLPLPDGVVDLAVMGYVLHEPPDASAFLHEVARVLRPRGRVLVIEWHKKDTEEGPPVEHRIAEQDAVKLLEAAGFDVHPVAAASSDVYVLAGVRLD
ncbi:MAG: class I SAM-dependent methyltransferase [Chloroflexota bacterium]